MPAEIISVGTELLLGQITDTNATFMCERLAETGVDVHFRSTVGDNRDRIVRRIRHAMEQADIVILTGGLGPTPDDLTREAMAEACGRGMYRDPDSQAVIRAFFERRGYPMAEMNLKQADVPEGGFAIPNTCGTAPGVFLEHQGCLLLAVPGVPREMREMMVREVIPRLRQYGRAGASVIRSRTLRLFGMGESMVARAVQDLLSTQQNPTIAPLAGQGEVVLRLTAKSPTWDEAGRLIAELEAEVRGRLGSCVFGEDDTGLPEVVVRTLTERRQSLSTAESCTGGLIGSRITDVSGSSRCYAGGVVSYSNEAKSDLLGVPPAVIDRHGAVSPEVAELMARGVRERFGTDYGLSATGIAGPDGGTAEKPVGLVYVGLASPHGVSVERHMFTQNRLDNKLRSSQAALDLVRRHLQDAGPPP